MDEFSGLRYIVSILLLWIIFRKTDSTCTLPASLVSDWNDVTKSATVTFTSTQLIRWNLTVAGESKYSHTCISNTGNVYVFRGDTTYNELVDKNYYICMKLTQVTSNLYYYYLLADPNSKANNARIYTPDADPISSAPTCDYCSYSNAIPDNSYNLLQKTGTLETPTTAPSLCLPCASDCSTTTPPQSTGSQQTSPQSTGSQQTPPQSTGSQQTSPQSTGSQQTSPQSTGPQQDASQTDSSDTNIPLIVGLAVPIGVVTVTGISIGIAAALYKSLVLKGSKVADTGESA